MVEAELRCEWRELAEPVGYAVVSGIGGASLVLSFLLLREKNDLPPLDEREALSLENILPTRRTIAALRSTCCDARTWAQAQHAQVSPVCRPGFVVASGGEQCTWRIDVSW
jgi:hypothetical protein